MLKENPDYTFKDFVRENYPDQDDSHELEWWASYKEEVMVCVICEEPATLLAEINGTEHLTCEKHGSTRAIELCPDND